MIDVFARLHMALLRYCQISVDIEITDGWGEWSPCGEGVDGRWHGCQFDLVRITTPGDPGHRVPNKPDGRLVGWTVVEHRPLRGLVLLEVELATGEQRYLMNADWLSTQQWAFTDDYAHDRDEMQRVALAIQEATTRLVPSW